MRITKKSGIREKDSQINTPVSYISIFADVIPKLSFYLYHLIKEFKKYDENSEVSFIPEFKTRWMG
jgi:hypothetical protein